MLCLWIVSLHWNMTLCSTCTFNCGSWLSLQTLKNSPFQNQRFYQNTALSRCFSMLLLSGEKLCTPSINYIHKYTVSHKLLLWTMTWVSDSQSTRYYDSSEVMIVSIYQGLRLHRKSFLGSQGICIPAWAADIDLSSGTSGSLPSTEETTVSIRS